MPSSRVLKLLVAYEGTRYVGWQRQPNGVSIQGLLEAALLPLSRAGAVKVAGAGRTDAGVHARGQVASCEIASELDTDSIQRALNARLPEDVRVWAVSDAEPGFHARYSAAGKTYAYYVLNGATADPLLHRFVWHVPRPLDINRMRCALGTIVGTHDFHAFQAAGGRVSSTTRTIWRAVVAEVDTWGGPEAWVKGAPPGSRLLVFTFAGDGFLRHMVRNLVGTVVEVGFGGRAGPGIGEILASGDRAMAGQTAPPQGLTLVSVDYAATPRRRGAVGDVTPAPEQGLGE